MNRSPFRGPPFAGCAATVQVENQETLNGLVTALSTCEHPHNFAVQKDGLQLWCSVHAVQCLISQGQIVNLGVVEE